MESGFDPDIAWRIPFESTDSMAFDRAGEFCVAVMRKYPGTLAVSVLDIREPAGVMVFCQPPIVELVQDATGLRAAATEFIVSGGDCPDPSTYA
jgi:hypothetical protein